MITYTCLVIDDEKLARKLIEKHLAQLDNFELVASCTNAIEASNYLQKQHIDLLFLDIEMPILNGTDFFKSIPNKPKVIFTTAYRDYALDGFELNAVDYLLKPIVFKRFFVAIQKFLSLQNNIIDSIKTTNDDFIFVKMNRKQIKIVLNEILYIESLKNYIKIHLSNSINHTIKYSLSLFEKELDFRFVRVHRSFIINRDKITAYTKNDVEIGKFEIPIGDNYRKNIDM